MSEKPKIEKMLILTFGQSIGFSVQLILPFFLSRHLAIDDYGTFKQIVIFQWIILEIAHLGMDNSIFQFVSLKPRKHAVYSLNAMAISACVGAFSFILFFFFAESIAVLLNNPALAEYLPYLAVYILFAVTTQQIENYLVVLNKISLSAFSAMASIALHSLAVLVGYYFFQSLKVILLIWIALEASKFFCLLLFNLFSHKRLVEGSVVASMRATFREQFRYSLPIGIANIVTILLKLDRFVVAAFYSIKEFTIYTVGCFDIPLLPLLIFNMYDLMSLDMMQAIKDETNDRIKNLWHETLRRKFLITVPILIYLFFFAEKLILFVFTETYIESVKYFQIFIGILMISYLDPEIIFRVYGETKKLMNLQLAIGLISIGLIAFSAWLFEPWAVLLVKLLADMMGLFWKNYWASRYMKVGIQGIYQWTSLIRVTLISFVSVGVVYCASEAVILSTFWSLMLTFPLFVTIYLVLCRIFKVFESDEIEYAKEKMLKLFSFS